MLKMKSNQKDLLVKGTILSVVTTEKKYSLKESLVKLGLSNHREALKDLATIKQDIKGLELTSLEKKVIMKNGILASGSKYQKEMLQLLDKGFLSNARVSFINFYRLKVIDITECSIELAIECQAFTELGTTPPDTIASVTVDKKIDKIKASDWSVYLPKEIGYLSMLEDKFQDAKKGVDFKDFLESQEMKLKDLKRATLSTLQYWTKNNID